MSHDTIASRVGDAPTAARPARFLAFIYGVAAYLFFFVAFLYLIAFVGGVFVPKSVDTGVAGPTGVALVINLVLIALFGIQHSVMARPGFKRGWTKFVPKPIERSTYVLLSTVVLIVVMAFWQPMPEQIWLVENAIGAGVLWALFLLGWAVLLASTFMTDHFDLFGLRQVFVYLLGKPYAPINFKARFLYKHMRHPLYTGFLIAFWATPDMTLGHLVLAAGFTTYIVIGTLLEERDLMAAFGQTYRDYCRDMPRYVPRLMPRKR